MTFDGNTGTRNTDEVHGSIGNGYSATPRRYLAGAGMGLRAMGLLVLALLVSVVFAGRAQAQAPVGLGTSDSFAVLGGSTVTNTGPSVISGDLGVSPGSAVVGFPPGLVVNGTIHAADAVAAQAQSDLTVAYNDAAGRACNTVLTDQDLGGLTLTSGVYCFSTSAGLTGDLTLDAQGDPNAVFIFQIGSTLTTASASNVNLINGAQACNVYWQIGSSATLGTTTTFVGNVLALTSITATTGATVDGRLLARNAATTLDTNLITRAECASEGGPGGGGGGGGEGDTTGGSSGTGGGSGGGGGGGGTDDTGPVVDIGGAPGDGVKGNPTGTGKPGIAKDFKLLITAKDQSGIKKVEVFLDGKRIKKTSRGRFLVWIRAKNLRAGRHTIRVVAHDRRGNRSVKVVEFGRRGLPTFTG